MIFDAPHQFAGPSGTWDDHAIFVPFPAEESRAEHGHPDTYEHSREGKDVARCESRGQHRGSE
jgi:hypothetical protein